MQDRSAPPLTHHQIIALAEPFVRRGRQVDLQASDRLARRLLFKPISTEVPDPQLAGLTEVLQIDQPEPGRYRLTRLLTLPGGLQAGLQAEGAKPDDLLALVETVPAARQFDTGAGWRIARWHRLDATAHGATRGRPIFMHGIAELGEIQLALTLSGTKGMPAELRLAPVAGDSLTLPEDLFAVLGLAWSLLRLRTDGWHASLRLRGDVLAQAGDAERRLTQAAAHLARTLAEPPARFHEQRVAARWAVAARRALPLLACVLLIAGAAAVPRLGLADDSALRMLIFNAPPLLLILVFCLRELPRFEIPPIPRRPSTRAWRDPPSSR
ncbi:MAG: hypothetical protein IPM01_05610 [Burkholderiaceae bacterium]|nr:hypothetical protein [Burkholderiaceae bacterium]